MSANEPKVRPYAAELEDCLKELKESVKRVKYLIQLAEALMPFVKHEKAKEAPNGE